MQKNLLLQAPCLILLLILSQKSFSQCCSYTLSMHDSYGDGWNGGYLTVYLNDNLLSHYWATGYGSASTIDVCPGDKLRFNYTAADYENENTYELYGPTWNLLEEDGPNPATGDVFVLNADCNGTEIPGSHPCLAIPIDTTDCLIGDNTNMPGSGMNPYCADYKGADMWYVFQIPKSGNISIATDSGSINDSGLAVWSDGCAGSRLLACDDDAGNEAFSFLTLYELPAYQNLYIQVFGYSGGKGTFRLCVKDLGVIKLDSSELPIININTLGQPIQYDQKVDALMEIRYQGDHQITYASDLPNVYNGHIGIEIRGASSSGYPQRPYGLETRLENGENNTVSLLDMPEESDWVLLSNFNDRSLVRNLISFELFRDMGQYAPRMRLSEVLVDSIYKGIYLFGEKIKRDKGRVDIAKLYPEDIDGDQVTGGYILQQNYWNENTSFQSNYAPIDHPGFDIHFVYEYPKPDDIVPEQKTYIAEYVDSLETALYSDEFMDPNSGYRKYLDTKSFIDYFILNELARNNDGFKKSVFFYKDRKSHGGLLKAGPVWDFDWAWKNLYGCDEFDNLDGSGWAHHINDCPTDNYSCGWMIRLLQDTTFTEELKCTYTEYRKTILDTSNIFHYIDSVEMLVGNAQQRHFQKWPILGISGPAPEIGAVATTYPAELDTLKSWIKLRLNWLDENMPGICSPITNTYHPYPNDLLFSYAPVPSNGTVYFERKSTLSTPATLILYDSLGQIVSVYEPRDPNHFEIELPNPGIFFFNIYEDHVKRQTGKLMAR